MSLQPETSNLENLLATAIFNIHLLGKSQIYADFVGSSIRSSRLSSSRRFERSEEIERLERFEPGGGLVAVVLETEFEPLPFDEAIDFFRSKLNLSPAQFEQLSEAARTKAFTIAGGATRQVRRSIMDLLDQAVSEGKSLSDFQRQGNEVLDRAGLSERTPWYWQTVYRTNLQTSYQVGRWKQMTDPAVVAARPFLRYVSARLPTSRQSHVEKHGRIYPPEHSFWSEWYPPNGFNCYCTVMSISQSLLDRRGWRVSSNTSFNFQAADQGFQVNPGRAEEI